MNSLLRVSLLSFIIVFLWTGLATAQNRSIPEKTTCVALWKLRNEMFKEAGYCFKSGRAIAEFGNNGCKFDGIRDVPLSQNQRMKIDDISRAEKKLKCDIDEGSQLYTPRIGSPERLALMEAARIAVQTRSQFKVVFLAVFRKNQSAIAMAELEPVEPVEAGGVFFFEQTIRGWKVIYSLGGGGGSSDCKDAREIVQFVLTRISDLDAPKSFLPPRFQYLKTEAESKDVDSSCSIAERYDRPQ